jgi:putative flavoprotein involved in K+ transport
VTERIETLIVGGGQAALALSHHLRARGREHVILERARVAERWRSERWDSLTFQFPRWSIALPGFAHTGGDPEGFAPRDEVVRFLDDYRARIAAPVREGVTVRAVSVAAGPGRFHVETDAGAFAADHVVAATGPYQEPALPPAAARVPSDVVQVHSSRYRNPGTLPPGAVLVVGSGASGCQITEDLVEAGRAVFLSVGHHRRVPRRYRGHDVFWWMDRTGRLDQSLEQSPGARGSPNPLVTGARGGHDVDLRDYPGQGVILLGHLQDARDGRLFLADDVAEQIARGDEGMVAFARRADEWALRAGWGPPRDEERVDRVPPLPSVHTPETLGLRAAGISAVIWATGFRPDFGWVRLPVLDDAGDAVHRLGTSACPGFYFLGLPWLSKLKSSVLCGVGEDAERIANAIAGSLEASPGRA